MRNTIKTFGIIAMSMIITFFVCNCICFLNNHSTNIMLSILAGLLMWQIVGIIQEFKDFKCDSNREKILQTVHEPSKVIISIDASEESLKKAADYNKWFNSLYFEDESFLDILLN